MHTESTSDLRPLEGGTGAHGGRDLSGGQSVDPGSFITMRISIGVSINVDTPNSWMVDNWTSH